MPQSQNSTSNGGQNSLSQPYGAKSLTSGTWIYDPQYDGMSWHEKLQAIEKLRSKFPSVAQFGLDSGANIAKAKIAAYEKIHGLNRSNRTGISGHSEVGQVGAFHRNSSNSAVPVKPSAAPFASGIWHKDDYVTQFSENEDELNRRRLLQKWKTQKLTPSEQKDFTKLTRGPKDLPEYHLSDLIHDLWELQIKGQRKLSNILSEQLIGEPVDPSIYLTDPWSRGAENLSRLAPAFIPGVQAVYLPSQGVALLDSGLRDPIGTVKGMAKSAYFWEPNIPWDEKINRGVNFAMTLFALKGGKGVWDEAAVAKELRARGVPENGTAEILRQVRSKQNFIDSMNRQKLSKAANQVIDSRTYGPPTLLELGKGVAGRMAEENVKLNPANEAIIDATHKQFMAEKEAARGQLDKLIKDKVSPEKIKKAQSQLKKLNAEHQAFIDNVRQGGGKWQKKGDGMIRQTRMDPTDLSSAVGEFQRIAGREISPLESDALKKEVDLARDLEPKEVKAYRQRISELKEKLTGKEPQTVSAQKSQKAEIARLNNKIENSLIRQEIEDPSAALKRKVAAQKVRDRVATSKARPYGYEGVDLNSGILTMGPKPFFSTVGRVASTAVLTPLEELSGRVLGQFAKHLAPDLYHGAGTEFMGNGGALKQALQKGFSKESFEDAHLKLNTGHNSLDLFGEENGLKRGDAVKRAGNPISTFGGMAKNIKGALATPLQRFAYELEYAKQMELIEQRSPGQRGVPVSKSDILRAQERAYEASQRINFQNESQAYDTLKKWVEAPQKWSKSEKWTKPGELLSNALDIGVEGSRGKINQFGRAGEYAFGLPYGIARLIAERGTLLPKDYAVIARAMKRGGVGASLFVAGKVLANSFSMDKDGKLKLSGAPIPKEVLDDPGFDALLSGIKIGQGRDPISVMHDFAEGQMKRVPGVKNFDDAKKFFEGQNEAWNKKKQIPRPYEYYLHGAGW